MSTFISEDTQETISLESYATILDVDVTVYAELDSRIVSFAELVNLDINSLLPLTRPSGENIDLYIGDVLLGNGEILVVDGCLAIRVADLRDKPSLLRHANSTEASD